MISRVREWILANALLLVSILAALSIVGFAVQTVRIDGFRIDPPLLPAFGPKGLLAENADLAADKAKLLAQREAAIADSLRIAAENVRITRKADADVTENLAQEITGADAFIAAGGVRRCPSARANATPGSEGSGVDAGAGALPFVDDVSVVAVLPEDVRICTENTVKARAWREWGLAIEANQKPATP